MDKPPHGECDSDNAPCARTCARGISASVGHIEHPDRAGRDVVQGRSRACCRNADAVAKLAAGPVRARPRRCGRTLGEYIFPAQPSNGYGETGHAESVKITYLIRRRSRTASCFACFSRWCMTPRSYGQGPDSGTQYRSVIFYGSDEQKRIAEAYIAQLDKARMFPRPITTQVVPLRAFYPAEAYHQDYATNHPNNPYIVYNDAPKVAHLHQEFPELYTGK